MKHWRKIIIFTMVLVMPISSWASVMLASHCQTSDSTSHSMHTQMSDGESKHAEHQMPSQEVNDHSDCDCGCDGSLDCSVSGCSAPALSNAIGFDLEYSTHPVYKSAQSLADPSDPNLLFRPPIYIS